MKKLLLIGMLMFPMLLIAEDKAYFPINHAPESTQSVYGGINKGNVSAGVELHLRGTAEKNWIESLVGDWSDFDHSLSVGYLTEGFSASKIYAGVTLSVVALDSVGVGIKQIIFYETDKAIGNRLKGETNLIVFYQLAHKNLLFSEEQEYLSFYLGFKSDVSNFETDGISEIVNNSLNLWEVSKKMSGGFFYSPNVTWKTFRGISGELNGNGAFFLSLHISA